MVGKTRFRLFLQLTGIIKTNVFIIPELTAYV